MSAPKIRSKEHWGSWAWEYRNRRYRDTGSYESVKTAFRDLLAFFKEKKILVRRQVTYEIAAQFIP